MKNLMTSPLMFESLSSLWMCALIYHFGLNEKHNIIKHTFSCFCCLLPGSKKSDVVAVSLFQPGTFGSVLCTWGICSSTCPWPGDTFRAAMGSMTIMRSFAAHKIHSPSAQSYDYSSLFAGLKHRLDSMTARLSITSFPAQGQSARLSSGRATFCTWRFRPGNVV